MAYVGINSDLVFADDQLEHRYRVLHTDAQRKMDIQFHYARSLTWGAVGLRMLKDSSAFRHYVAAITVLLGALTTLLPAYLPKRMKSDAYVKWRPLVIFADNVLQVTLGCFTHSHIYPEAPTTTSWTTAPAWKAFAVYMTGSGFAWLNMSGLLGSLIFRFGMPQQTVLTGILLLASPGMCQRSWSLQRAFVVIHRQLGRFSRRLILPALLYKYATQFLSNIGVLSSAAATTTTAGIEDGLRICEIYQPISLTILGLILPTLYLYWRELRSRCIFVRSSARAAGLSPDDFIIDPMPSIWEYLMFAVPAVGALLAYIVSFG